MPRPEKERRVYELREDIQSANGFILTDYRGLTVSQITALRKRLREAGARYKVVKNSLFLRAVEGKPECGVEQFLVGPTAVAFVEEGDASAVAKAIVEFAREFRLPSIKGGYIEGHVYDVGDIEALAKAPPRDVLIANVVGAMQAPLVGLVGTLQGVLSNLVWTLQAVADRKAEA